MVVVVVALSATTPSPPTPIDPTISSTTEERSSGNPSTTVQQQQQQDEEEENKMDITSIGSGKAVHTIWADNTPGNFDIFYKRDGVDFDPSTINLSNDVGSSLRPIIAVSGNIVHAVWDDDTNEISFIKKVQMEGLRLVLRLI